MKLLPFDLEKASTGEPVVTKGGEKVIEFHLLPEWLNSPSPLVARFENIPPMNYKKDGSLHASCLNHLELFMLEEPKKYYVNIYKDSSGKLYPSRIFKESEMHILDGNSCNCVKRLTFTLDEEDPNDKLSIAEAMNYRPYDGE